MGDIKVYTGSWTAMPSREELSGNLVAKAKGGGFDARGRKNKQTFEFKAKDMSIVIVYNDYPYPPWDPHEGIKVLIPVFDAPNQLLIFINAQDREGNLCRVSVETNDARVKAGIKTQLFFTGIGTESTPVRRLIDGFRSPVPFELK